MFVMARGMRARPVGTMGARGADGPATDSWREREGGQRAGKRRPCLARYETGRRSEAAQLRSLPPPARREGATVEKSSACPALRSTARAQRSWRQPPGAHHAGLEEDEDGSEHGRADRLPAPPAGAAAACIGRLDKGAC